MKIEWHQAYKNAFDSRYWADMDLPTQDSFHELLLEAANAVSDSIKGLPYSEDERSEQLTSASEELCKQLAGTHHLELNIFYKASSLEKDLAVLRKIFAVGGPFYGVEIKMPPEYQPFVFRVAPLIHLIIKEPETFQVEGGLPQFLANLELLRPGEIEKISKLLGVIQEFESTLSFDELMADVRSRIHDLISSNSRLASVQRRGGLEYLLTHGADVTSIVKRCDHSIANHFYAGETIEPFTQINKLTHDCLHYLESEKLIDVSEAKAIWKRLLSATLNLACLSEEKQNFDWAPMIKAAYTEGAEKDLKGIQFLTYVQYTPSDELNAEIIKDKVSSDPQYLKRELDVFFDKRVQNDLVSKLGMEHFYTSNELLNMRGHQFAGDLGL
jgi:hypothetical protein